MTEQADREAAEAFCRPKFSETGYGPAVAAFLAGAAHARAAHAEEVRELVEALERVVGTFERWTDEHGESWTHESDGSKTAREALAKHKGQNHAARG